MKLHDFQPSLKGLHRMFTILPSDESLGYFHIVPFADENLNHAVNGHGYLY